MVRLSEVDYRGALEVLRVAGEIDGPMPFPEPLLRAIRRLVRCDVVAYHEQPLGQPALAFTGEPLGAMTPDIRAAEVRYWRQDPMVPADGARKFSDFLSRREYHRLELYQEVSRPLGVEFMMRLWLDPQGGRGARLEFDRAGLDFDERDRAVLDTLLPHLRQHRLRVARRRHPEVHAPGATERLTRREYEVVELVAEGRSNAEVARQLWISPLTVRKHLENAYAKLGVHSRTAASAAVYWPERAAPRDAIA